MNISTTHLLVSHDRYDNESVTNQRSNIKSHVNTMAHGSLGSCKIKYNKLLQISECFMHAYNIARLLNISLVVITAIINLRGVATKVNI